MEQLKLIGQAIEGEILEKTERSKVELGDQNSRIVNAEVFVNEDAILDGLDKLFGSLNFNEKSLKAFLDKKK